MAKITSSFGETEEGGSTKRGRGCVNRLGSCKSSTGPAVLGSFLTATRRGKVGSGKHAFAPSGGWMKKCTTHFGEKQKEGKRAMEGHEDGYMETQKCLKTKIFIHHAPTSSRGNEINNENS